MKPYSKKRNPKGISGRRKSADSAHRRRSLRVDKKAARQNNENTCICSDGPNRMCPIHGIVAELGY